MYFLGIVFLENTHSRCVLDVAVFLLHACRLTRCTKSKMSLYLPFFSRSLMMASTAASPTPFTPPRPNRTSPFLVTVKFNPDSLTSGGNTDMRMARHSSINLVTSLMSSLATVRLAAMNSAG